MGFRFSLKNANAVGHLSEGNVLSFLDDTVYRPEMLIPNIEFISDFLSNPSDSMYTSDWSQFDRVYNLLYEQWPYVKDDLYNLDERTLDNYYPERILNFFYQLSGFLSRCKIKSLLLPGTSGGTVNGLMTDPYILQNLIRLHPGESALILQLKEQIYETEIPLLNVFSHFEKALDRIEQWPGVLIWDKSDSIFVPVESSDDLYNIFATLKYEKNAFRHLKAKAANKASQRKYAYLFHLSDLHFGNKTTEKRQRRVLQILENKLAELEDNSKAIPIITGDLMDSPKNVNMNAYLQFCEFLELKGFEEPIHILGNHDVDTNGIIKRLTAQKSVIRSLVTGSKVKVLKEINLGIICFDSNTGGKLAQGFIGEDQLMAIGNELDSIKNKKEFSFIALVHHHPKEIENPNWYSREWHEEFLGVSGYEKTMKLLDADIFLEWIEQRGIKYILHGHKHIPKIHTHKDITIIAAGSATGSIRHVEANKTFLTYNLIKYDIEQKKPVVCSIIAEEILGAGAKNMLVHQLQ